MVLHLHEVSERFVAARALEVVDVGVRGRVFLERLAAGEAARADGACVAVDALVPPQVLVVPLLGAQDLITLVARPNLKHIGRCVSKG